MKGDVQLQRDVLEHLDWVPGIDASQIGVTAHEGVVTLSGHVPTLTDRHTAEKITKRVHGVRAVADEIEVRPSDTHVRDDENLAEAAVHALKWDAKAREDRVQVVVSEGWITLEGSVAERFEADAADRAVRHLTGVRGVTNSIVINPEASGTVPQPTPRQVKDDIENALRRSAIVNSRRVTVEVDGDKVILMGDVHSHAEHEEVERIAWVPGLVSQVENCITITPWGCGPMEEWGY